MCLVTTAARMRSGWRQPGYSSWYKVEMKPKTKWILFEYVGTNQINQLSKPMSKQEAERERKKLPVKMQKRVGLAPVKLASVPEPW